MKYGLGVFKEIIVIDNNLHERNGVDYSSKWVGAKYFLATICGLD
jgi:hypothetical protein